jgi:hypothetical protein
VLTSHASGRPPSADAFAVLTPYIAKPRVRKEKRLLSNANETVIEEEVCTFFKSRCAFDAQSGPAGGHSPTLARSAFLFRVI